MIKVLFIHDCLVCGGAEQALYDLCVLLDKSQFEITVLVLKDGGIWERKFMKAGIKVVSIWDCQVPTNNPAIKFCNWVKRERIKKALHRKGKGLVSICLKDSFDIIVSYHVWEMHSVAFSGTSKSIKYIHGDVSTNPEYRKIMQESLDDLKKYDRIIAVSETARKSFSELTGIECNVSAHFNPLNSDNVHELALQRVINKDICLTMCAVGRLTYEKGFERLVRIHKRILERGIIHKLVIVGDGSQKKKINSVIRDLGVEDSVMMVGYTANPYPYMKQSDFVVCPSYTEGLSLTGMEALALGIPVVSAVPTIRELFGDKECGVITANDDESLEKGICKMLLDHEFLYKTKAEAEKRSSFFEGRRMVQEIEQELNTLMSMK